MLAIEPAAFPAGAGFADAVGELGWAIKELPPAPPATAVFLPGERGADEMAGRSRDGVPLASGTLSRLVALADKLAVPLPAPLR